MDHSTVESGGHKGCVGCVQRGGTWEVVRLDRHPLQQIRGGFNKATSNVTPIKSQSKTSLRSRHASQQIGRKSVRLDGYPAHEVGGSLDDAHPGILARQGWAPNRVCWHDRIGDTRPDGGGENRIPKIDVKEDAPLQCPVNDEVQFPATRGLGGAVTLDTPPSGHPPPTRNPVSLVDGLGFFAVISSIGAVQFHLDRTHP